MDGSGWQWAGVDGSGWEWMGMDGSGWERKSVKALENWAL